MKLSLSLAAILITSLITPFASAQNAQLSGLVKDKSDAVVPSATVTLTNIETSAVLTAKSGKTGLYVFASVVSGRYSLAGDAPGFAKTVVNNIKIDTAAYVSQDIILQIKKGSETIDVTSAPSAELTQTTGAISTVTDRELIESMPLNGRSLDTLFELTPGAIQTQSLQSAPGGYVINGQRATANNLTIDGVSANIALSSTQGQALGGIGLPTSASGGTNGVLPIDAVEEYRIQTSTYSAEFGRTPGGQIQVNSRSGTNTYHGALFEYFRNQVLDATDWFIEHARQKQPALRMNDFGGTFGGPVVKNKLFVFIAHDTLLMHQPQLTTFDVPTASERATANTVFQPLIAAFPSGNGGPDPNNPGTDVFNEPFSNVIATNSTSVRVDATFGSKLHLFERVNIAPSSFDERTLPAAQIAHLNYYTSTTGLAMVFSSRLTNDLSVGYARSVGDTIQYLGNVSDTNVAAAEKYVQSFFDYNTRGAFQFLGPGYSGFLLGGLVKNNQNQWNFVDTVAWSLGRHALKAGFDYRRTTPVVGPQFEVTVQTGAADPQTLANGTVEQYSYYAPGANYDTFPFLYKNISLFADDTWRMTNRLTLDYGVRWDVSPAPTDGRGGPLAITGSVDNPALVQLAPSGTPLWKTRLANWAPRLGFAYQVRNHPGYELVIRGGAGTFYDTGTSSAAQGTVFQQYPYSVSNTFYNLQFNQIDFSSFAFPPPSLPAFSLTVFDPKLRTPRTYEWSLTMEQALGSRSSLSLSYVGNDGEQLTSQTAYHNPNPQLIYSFGNLTVTDNGGHSNYQALQAQVRTRIRSSVQAYGSYVYSHALDTIDSEFSVANAGLPTRLANAGFDIRQVVTGALHWELPRENRNWLERAFASGWALDSIARLQTASPLTIQAAFDPAFYQTFHTVPRADIVKGIPIVIRNSVAPGGKQLNPAAFIQPASGLQGNSPVNAYRLFGLTQFDFSASKVIVKRERLDAIFRVDAFNIFNVPNFSNIDTSIIDSTFGQATKTYAGRYGATTPASGGTNQVFSNGGPRNIQLSLKMRF